MKDREHDRLRKQIEDDYREKLAALDLIWKMSKEQDAPQRKNGRRGSLLEAVRQAVSEKSGPFNLRDVEDSIRKQHAEMTAQRASISSALLTLVSDGELEITEQGRGRRPSIYRKKSKTG